MKILPTQLLKIDVILLISLLPQFLRILHEPAAIFGLSLTTATYSKK